MEEHHNQTRYEEIPKRVRNSLKARIENAVNKYGFNEFRKCAEVYIKNVKAGKKLQTEISQKEKELQELKKRK